MSVNNYLTTDQALAVEHCLGQLIEICSKELKGYSCRWSYVVSLEQAIHNLSYLLSTYKPNDYKQQLTP